MNRAWMLSPVPTLAVVPADEPEVGPFSTGQVLAGSYQIVCRLARGGMGVVYDARDLALERRVAIKAPLSAAFGPALRREALALASIHSSAFVTVFQLGREHDVEFMVMERIFGETLKARLDDLRTRGRCVGLAEALHVLVSITAALVSAHRAGVAHRDLKPANVILTPDRVVLVDLGLFVPEVLVGPDNEVSGSPEYVAPEVLRRDVARGEGPLVDLYALGVLAFELLTGSTPFVDARPALTLRKHLRSMPPNVCALREDVPRALGDLVEQLLAKDPKRRPVSAEAVLWELLAVGDRLRGPRRPNA